MNQEDIQITRDEQQKAQLFSNFKSGVSCFFWLAAITIVNMIIRMVNPESAVRMAVGLSVSKFLEQKSLAFLGAISPKTVSVTVGILLIVVLAGLGLIARNRNKAAYLAGMILYALDIIPAVLIKDFYAVIFHLIVLGFLIWGFINLLKLEKLEKEMPDEEESEQIPE